MKRAVVLLLAWLLAFGPAFAECGEPAADLAVEALAASGPEGEAVVEINSTLAGDDPSPESEQPQTPAAPEPEEAPEPTALSVRKSATKTVWLGTVYRFTVPGKTVKSYSSGDKRIATVSRKGIVTLKKAGRVKITAKLKSGRKVVLTLKVADPLTPAAVAINEGETATVGIDDTFPLSAYVSPQTAPQDVAWTNNRERVATVDENGLVTARAWGRATITAATPNKKTATFTLIVRKPYTKPFMISHAMGGIDGNNYTNCLEAFQENYAEGHREIGRAHV